MMPHGDTVSVDQAVLAGRRAQPAWAATSLSERLAVLRRARNAMAKGGADLAHLIASPNHPAREVLTSELIPLAEAIRFLEKRAPAILRDEIVDRTRGSRPLWLGGIRSIVRHEPIGLVGIFGPGNYPLFIPGVQVVQALAAGNSVLWKPGVGGTPAALAMHRLLSAAGLPDGLLHILPEDVAAGIALSETAVDKLFFTGSFANGCKVLRKAADRAVPTVMELSGCDAVFIRADADLTLAARAILFAFAFHGSRSCIAPRRVFVHCRVAAEFEALLARLLSERFGPARPADPAHATLLRPLIAAESPCPIRWIYGGPGPDDFVLLPCVAADIAPTSAFVAHDHFGPVLSIIPVPDDETALALNASCPFALGAVIFSRDATGAEDMARAIPAGTVVINDALMPTADPRTPFAGRGSSGFGATRGAEGLLEMTSLKVIHHRKGTTMPHLDTPKPGDADFFSAYLAFAHGSGLRQRAAAALRMLRILCKLLDHKSAHTL